MIKDLLPRTRRTSQKYKNRPSPNVSARDLCGYTEKGNDGHLWDALFFKDGSCRWVKRSEDDSDWEKKLKDSLKRFIAYHDSKKKNKKRFTKTKSKSKSK